MNSEFNDNVSVQPDGRIVLRLVGPLQAAGLSSGQLSAEINQAYSKELKNPSATVHVQNMPSRQVFVEGQVNHPGAFALQPGMTAAQAIADAGGQTDEAELSNVVLIRRDACGRPDGSRIDFASATNTPDKGEDVMLMPHDTIVVPRSRIANVDLWVKQYIRDLLPVAAVPLPDDPVNATAEVFMNTRDFNYWTEMIFRRRVTVLEVCGIVFGLVVLGNPGLAADL